VTLMRWNNVDKAHVVSVPGIIQCCVVGFSQLCFRCSWQEPANSFPYCTQDTTGIAVRMFFFLSEVTNFVFYTNIDVRLCQQ
jgi:hypothetical protein